jgi:effector-binding domain-containing protein
MFRGVGQAVGLFIQVRPVDLVRISQEDYLGSPPGAGDDSGWKYQAPTFSEYYLRQFKDNLEKNGFPSTFFANVGTMVRQKYLRKNELYSDEIFVFIDKSPDITLPIETIPAGTYLSLCCDVYEDEKKYAEKLLDEMQTHHLKPLGDYFCEVVTEYPDSSNGQRKIFYKMQVKVK